MKYFYVGIRKTVRALAGRRRERRTIFQAEEGRLAALTEGKGFTHIVGRFYTFAGAAYWKANAPIENSLISLPIEKAEEVAQKHNVITLRLSRTHRSYLTALIQEDRRNTREQLSDRGGHLTEEMIDNLNDQLFIAEELLSLL
jgi:hypothetical protein